MNFVRSMRAKAYAMANSPALPEVDCRARTKTGDIPPDVVEKLISGYNSGNPLRSLAVWSGYSKSIVRRVLVDNGVTMRTRFGTRRVKYRTPLEELRANVAASMSHETTS